MVLVRPPAHRLPANPRLEGDALGPMLPHGAHDVIAQIVNHGDNLNPRRWPKPGAAVTSGFGTRGTTRPSFNSPIRLSVE